MNRSLCLLLALLFAAAANLHLCWRIAAGGETLSAPFGTAAVVRGVLAAAAAADELSARPGAPPGLRPCLSLKPPSEDAAAVSGALLQGFEGAVLCEGCFVNGLYLGCTAEGDALREGLRRHIFGTRPPGAVSGRFTEEVCISPLYTRPGQESGAEELCLLVTKLVPVMYTDGEGSAVAG